MDLNEGHPVSTRSLLTTGLCAPRSTQVDPLLSSCWAKGTKIMSTLAAFCCFAWPVPVSASSSMTSLCSAKQCTQSARLPESSIAGAVSDWQAFQICKATGTIPTSGMWPISTSCNASTAAGPLRRLPQEMLGHWPLCPGPYHHQKALSVWGVTAAPLSLSHGGGCQSRPGAHAPARSPA